jgi:hypothetical protein
MKAAGNEIGHVVRLGIYPALSTSDKVNYNRIGGAKTALTVPRSGVNSRTPMEAAFYNRALKESQFDGRRANCVRSLSYTEKNRDVLDVVRVLSVDVPGSTPIIIVRPDRAGPLRAFLAQTITEA